MLAKNFEDVTWGLVRKETRPTGDLPLLYEGSDLSTKLKLWGAGVASFGSSLDFWFKRQFDDIKDSEQGMSNTIQASVVVNSEDYFSRQFLAKQDDFGKKRPGDLFLGGASSHGDAEDLCDDAVVGLCQKVTKGQAVDAV